MVSYGFYWLVERMHWALLEGSEGKISIKHCPRTKRDRNPNKNWLKAVWKGLKGEICCIKCKLCWYRFADLSSFWFHGSCAGGLARGGLNIYVYICIFYLILLSSQFSVSLVAKQYVQFASGTGGCIFVRGHSLRFVCKGQAYALFAKNLFWNSIMQYLTCLGLDRCNGPLHAVKRNGGLSLDIDKSWRLQVFWVLIWAQYSCFTVFATFVCSSWCSPANSCCFLGVCATKLTSECRYVRNHGFLKFMSKRRIIVGNEKKPVQQVGQVDARLYWELCDFTRFSTCVVRIGQPQWWIAT